VEPGASLGTLLLAEGRVLAFAVAASATYGLRLDAPASWTGSDGSRQQGRVRSIAGGVEASSGLVEVRVAPDREALRLPPGLVVRGEIERGRLAAALLVPDRAVLRSGDRLAVVVAGADGAAHVRTVVVRGSHGGLTAVEGELAATDRVIVAGGYNLPDGAHVVEQAQAPPAPPAAPSPGPTGGRDR
jgi:membrane fusion protein (multidrug efflux system)